MMQQEEGEGKENEGQVFDFRGKVLDKLQCIIESCDLRVCLTSCAISTLYGIHLKSNKINH